MDKKFNVKKLEKLNNPNRLISIPPSYIWGKLDIENCKTIVDVGAGTGLFSKAFYELMDDGIVYSLDISQIMIDWIKENISSNNIGIKPIIMTETIIPLENKMSDLVIMIALHHELDKPIEILREVLRILKPTGKICIIDWKNEEMPFGPPINIRCSVKDISKQLSLVGFNNIQIDNSLDMFSMLWAEK